MGKNITIIKMENVTEENCKGCPVFESDTDEVRQNAIKNNICPKRELEGCDWIKEK